MNQSSDDQLSDDADPLRFTINDIKYLKLFCQYSGNLQLWDEIKFEPDSIKFDIVDWKWDINIATEFDWFVHRLNQTSNNYRSDKLKYLQNICNYFFSVEPPTVTFCKELLAGINVHILDYVNKGNKSPEELLLNWVDFKLKCKKIPFSRLQAKELGIQGLLKDLRQ